jgi:hypothetical protein
MLRRYVRRRRFRCQLALARVRRREALKAELWSRYVTAEDYGEARRLVWLLMRPG